MPNARRVSLALIPLAVTAFSATCFAQSPATFRTETFTERASTLASAVDVNNDGVPDLIQFPTQPTTPSTTFTVRIANGDGAFGAPVTYSFSSQYPGGGNEMASGDFNGDGNVDLIFELGAQNQFVLYLGKGDGTFQAPKVITIDVPSGNTFSGPFLAADFNGDGKLDLAAVQFTNSANVVALIPGDGTGNFGTPSTIYTPPANHGVGNGSNDHLLVGDFNGDGRADIAFSDEYNCQEGECNSTLHVLYNDGNSQFTDIATSASSPQGQGLICVTGDLNSDGQTDISCLPVSQQLVVLYGQTDRTFHSYTSTIPAFVTWLAMADFNGDTRMDLVGTADNSGQLVFFLADSSEGQFTQQTYGIPKYPGVTGLVAGDFNSDTRPDALLVMEPSQNFTNTTSILVEALNTTASGNWGGCAYPKSGMGIMVCAPGPSPASPVTFNASANSFGQLRKMELWLDGKKIAEQHHTWGSRAWFDLTGTTIAPGPHNAVVFAADIDNRLQKTAFAFDIAGATCSVPTSPGVNICMPVSGSTVSSPVQVEASATVTGTIANMQLWVDGVKKFTAPSNTLSTSISLAAGTHRFAVLAVNTVGQKWESAVNATVK